MRYIGCKQRLLPFIHDTIKENNIQGKVFCDLFAGTATVGHYFKTDGYKILSNDLLYASYIMQQAKIGINKMPRFDTIAHELGLKSDDKHTAVYVITDYLNNLQGNEGFIYKNYSYEGTQDQPVQRLYYSEANAKKIDAIRTTIEEWKVRGFLSDKEFYILLYMVIQQASRCANTTATMSSFLKSYAAQALRSVTLQVPIITQSLYQHQVYCEDGIKLISKLENIDILYLDPPYTAAQYGTSYHLMETIARWDRPELHGASGRREIAGLYSSLSSKANALQALEQIVSSRCYKHMLLSYSSDGLIPHEALLLLLEHHGTVKVKRQLLRRYNTLSLADERRNPNQLVEERLYYLKPL